MGVDAFFPIFPIAIMAAIFTFVIVASVRQQRRGQENLRKLAEQLGFNPPAPVKNSIFKSRQTRLTGEMRGRTLSVYAYTTGSGKQRQSWCALAVPAKNPRDLKLRISGENIFTRAGRVLGIEDVAIGDEAFDRQFYVKSNDAAYARVALIPEVRTRLLETWKLGATGTISADGAEVKYAEQGSFANARICARFPALAELVCDVADIVETHAG